MASTCLDEADVVGVGDSSGMGGKIDSNRAGARLIPTIQTSIGRVVATQVQRSHGRVPREGYRRLGAFALVLVLAGTGSYRDEQGVETTVSVGDMILVFPELGHAYGPDAGTSWLERYVLFEGPAFDLWSDHGVFDRRQPVVRLADVNAWNARIDRLFGDSGMVGVIPSLEEICRLQLFLAEALRTQSSPESASAEDREWLSTASALLSTSSPARDDALTLRSIAATLSLSYDGFRKRFRRLAGISPGRYRSIQQINQACTMIQLGTMTDRQIAEALGFHDESHFSRRFKSVMSRTPSAFRAALPSPRT